MQNKQIEVARDDTQMQTLACRALVIATGTRFGGEAWLDSVINARQAMRAGRLHIGAPWAGEAGSELGSPIAVIGGADHWTEVVEFGESKLAWFATFLKLPNGIASHDTFARVFRLINTEALEKACQQWLAGLVGRVQGVVAIDGKSVRGARDGKRHPLHIVSAWASHHGLLLGQVRTAEKSNEITAIPELLKLLSIQGCIVTIDAMGCQKTIAQEIISSQADYVLGLKSNHRHLCLGVASWFEKSLADGFAKQPHSHYLEPAGPSSHWAVENELHWSLDMGFREDACQVRKDYAPANLACIRRIALTQLRQETTKKLGIQGKRRRAGWDQAYMETVLKMGSI